MKRLHLWAAVSCLLFSACPKEEEAAPLTEVVIQIFADQLVQEAGDTLIVEFKSGARSASELTAGEPERFDLTADDFRWPVTITLVAKASHEGHVFELNLRLEKAGEVITRGRIQSGFVKGQTLVLQTSLGAECLGKLDCADDETCVVNDGRASCESASVDPDKLPTVPDAPKSNDGGTAPLDAGKQSDAGNVSDAGHGDGGYSHDAATHDSGFDAGSCIAISAQEECGNGLDDDCNGATDCADSTCQGILHCVPDALAYVLVNIEKDCPIGYEPYDELHQDLQDLGCSGCTCYAESKQCEPYVSVYTTLISCERDRPPFTGGTTVPNAATETCSAPIGKQLDLASDGFGFAVHVKAGDDTCKPDGTPYLNDARWNVSVRRCRSKLPRGGCNFGNYCAPTDIGAQLCLESESGSCGDGEWLNSYYLSYDDRRTCEACGCTAKGGSCEDVGAALAEPNECAPGKTVLRDSQASCEPVSREAYIRSTGRPRDPECNAHSQQQGSLEPTGAVNLCCVN